jgi:peptidoglycan/LPS O-acetylase OafA/YrhL
VKRHRLDPISLAFGSLLALVGLAFLVGNPNVTDPRVQWMWPLAVVLIGVLIIVAALRRGNGSAAP